MHIPTLSTHASKLERWLGADTIEHMSKSMKDWYGPPIAVGGVPGKVFAHRGGDFRGRIATGLEASVWCATESFINRTRRSIRQLAREQARSTNVGFASLSDLIAETTAGKKFTWTFYKTGATGVIGVTNSLWGLGAQPAAGANAANAPGGEALTDATTGAISFTNPTGGDTTHLTTANVTASVAGNTLLLYDRLFQVNKTMNSTATEAVTGVPTRYQSTTGGAANSAEGNFLFVEVGGTALAATAHNWTTCLYTDQGGATGVTLPSLTGNSGAIVRRLDHPTHQWFAPLATGDTGILALTQMQCSALVATGVINFVIGHPLMWMPCPIANLMCTIDGINTAFNLVRVFDDAALAFLEVNKPATTATNYNVVVEASYG